MTGDKVILELRSRFQGELNWFIRKLELLFKNQGGKLAGQTLLIGLNSRYGSAYTSCVIHGPAKLVHRPMRIPNNYEALLRRFNGAKLFALDLFGILDEGSNRRRCLSLELANEVWIREYKSLPSNSFHFGSRKLSYSENIGYFYNQSGQVYSARKSGEILDLWDSIEEMLRAEWEVSRKVETETRDSLAKDYERRNMGGFR